LFVLLEFHLEQCSTSRANTLPSPTMPSLCLVTSSSKPSCFLPFSTPTERLVHTYRHIMCPNNCFCCSESTKNHPNNTVTMASTPGVAVVVPCWLSCALIILLQLPLVEIVKIQLLLSLVDCSVVAARHDSTAATADYLTSIDPALL